MQFENSPLNVPHEHTDSSFELRSASKHSIERLVTEIRQERRDIRTGAYIPDSGKNLEPALSGILSRENFLPHARVIQVLLSELNQERSLSSVLSIVGMTVVGDTTESVTEELRDALQSRVRPTEPGRSNWLSQLFREGLSKFSFRTKEDDPSPSEKFGAQLAKLLLDGGFEISLSEVRAENVLDLIQKYYAESGSRDHQFEDLVKALAVILHNRFQRDLEGKENQEGEAEQNELWEELDRKLPESVLAHLSTFLGSYLGEDDLESLGIEERSVRERVLREMNYSQLLGEILTRREALKTVIEKLSIHPVVATRALMERRDTSGADPRQFLQVKEGEPYIDEEGGFQVRHFECRSKEQYRAFEVKDEVHWELHHGGNYPAITKELTFCEMTEHDVIVRLLRGEVSNLAELEEFCRMLQWKRSHLEHATEVSLRTTAVISASSASFATVERMKEGGSIKRITLGIGYHGESEGIGLRHLLERRSADGSLDKFQHAGEDQLSTLDRFVWDAVVYCMGVGEAIIPSRKSPTTHKHLYSAIRGEKKQFVSHLLGRVNSGAEDGEYYVVTTFFYKNGKALRNTVKRELRGWLEHKKEEGTALTKEEVAVVLDPMNTFLDANEIRTLTLDEISENGALMKEVTRGSAMKGLSARPIEPTFGAHSEDMTYEALIEFEDDDEPYESALSSADYPVECNAESFSPLESQARSVPAEQWDEGTQMDIKGLSFSALTRVVARSV